MKRKILTLILSLVLLFSFASPAFAQEPDGAQVVFGENFTLEAEKTLDRDLVVFGGDVTLEKSSQVEGDVVVFGGNVQVDGTIDGDVGLIGGNITLGETAVVEGDVGLVGGTPHIVSGAVIEGEIHSLTNFGYDYGDHHWNDDDDDNDEEPAQAVPPVPTIPAVPTVPAAPTAPAAPHAPDFQRSWDHRPSIFEWVGDIVGDIVGTIAVLVVLSLITWVVAAFMPEQMGNVRNTVLQSAPLSFGLGLVTAIAAIVVSPLALLLLVTICLAIIPIVVYIGLGVAALFGWIVIGQIIGERLLLANGRTQPSFVLSSLVGVWVITLLAKMPVIGQIPCIGFLLCLIGALFFFLFVFTGLGAVLLTRFGTRPYPGPDYTFSGSGRPSPSPIGSNPRVRWAGPEPNVSAEEHSASEVELNARIKAALAEADEAKTTPDKKPAAEEPGSDKTPGAEKKPAQDKPKKARTPRKKAEDEPEAPEE